MASVARWLETFTCSKYADQFEQLGYSTLQSVRAFYLHIRSSLLFSDMPIRHFSIAEIRSFSC